MPIHQDCIHWRVCTFPCPSEPEQCVHYKAEVTSRWEDRLDSMHCPVCGSLWPYRENETHRFAHCPTCGTKMVSR